MTQPPEHRPAVTYRRRPAPDAKPVVLTADQRRLWEEIKALPYPSPEVG